VRCVIFPEVRPISVQVLQDLDVVLTENFAEEWLALNWARAYGDRLKAQGWHDIAEPLPPPSGLSEQRDRRDP